MKVIVLGSGVIGVTTAWYLANLGAEVVVMDRQPAPALETSYANAGQLSYGMSSPWAAPGIPRKALKWSLMRHSPLSIWPMVSPKMWSWGLSMLANCNPDAYRINKERMVRVSEYSRRALGQLLIESGADFDFDLREKGTLQLFRSQMQVSASTADQEILSEFGSPFEVLDRAGCVAAEPGLASVSDSFVGGLRLPGDRTGDCHKFARSLASMATERGVDFRYNVNITGLEYDGCKIVGVWTDRGYEKADAYVCCLGSYSPRLLRGIGISLPVYPVKGYSITVPVSDPHVAPQSTIMDETYKVAITRLGDRVRVAGQAELIGYNKRLGKRATDTVRFVLQSLFPGGVDLSRVESWTGLRPMTPDGPPVIGGTAFKNLFLNTGHGTLGWTMACGSSRIVSDLVLGREPEVNLEGLDISRYAN